MNVSNITFTHGAASGHDHNGGALNNDGTMRIEDCDFLDNSAVAGGGAVANTGDMYLERVSFSGNRADNAGALSSSGSSDRSTSLVGRQLRFERNAAAHSAGAIFNAQGRMELIDVVMSDHVTQDKNALGGTLLNGDRGHLVIRDSSLSLSHAGSGGLLANGASTSYLLATRVDFSHGNATDFAGGAIANKGEARLESCRFWENMAHSPYNYAQGATLALTEVNATGTLLNCTIDAGRARRSMDQDIPSELFALSSGALLNLTFVKMTNCHRDVIKLEAPGTPGHPDRKVIVRGSSLCADGSAGADAVDPQTLAMIAGCAQPGWQCGERAVCTELATLSGGVAGAPLVSAPAAASAPLKIGIQCECPRASTLRPENEWGFPYGGDPIIPGSSGFDGCFEQWDAALGELSASGCAVTPPDVTSGRLDYACCALRDAAQPSRAVSAAVHGEPDSDGHAGLPVYAPASAAVSVSHAAPYSPINVSVTSFDRNRTLTYTVHVSWLPGDAHCKLGAPTYCRNASGGEKVCASQTKYPIDLMHGTAHCVAGSTAHAADCGYTTFDAPCECPVCVASKQYACDEGCPVGGTDGTATCAADGKSLSTCDCDTPFAFYPPSAPPPPSPPTSPSNTVAVVGGIAAALLLLVGGGAVHLRRSSRARELQGMSSSLLVNVQPDPPTGALPAGQTEPVQQPAAGER